MTSPFAAPAAALAWLGRQGTRAIAASVFLGLALPQLAALMKPLLPSSIFVLLVLAFLRVNPSALRDYLTRPALVIAAAVWIMVIAPALYGFFLIGIGVKDAMPALFLALMFQASAAPIMSAPAFAALLGLDAALSLAAMIACIVLTPLLPPLYLYLFADAALAIHPGWLALKLFLLLAGSAGLAAIIRRVMTTEWVAAQGQRIDGINVITLTVFAIAIMDGVTAAAIKQPLLVLGFLALAFAFAFSSMLSTLLVFRFAGKEKSWALGWSAANRNMGIMIAAMGTSLPDTTWLYMGLAQFPIYLFPLMIQPLIRRVMARPD
ncbi:hypothetical protein GJW-30_1_02607 [Variibacter gotjawalensis]|uniref:Sodium Bile acid symporter family protein n=1 Tax=Variibacter gotjawalensis TaxID=1333996 RepID=A0A0S3PVV4_9BRAD|nr:hypothetical protein [Variibacter gotjawalensis]NIK45898.1 BASS family bile acid:Na+ symporter [Variibacter gotjawalensis]RZS47818.1 BASS family bile acid:Na+ symporter [Variibacter gotjawalensis]BAT60072.1 hypothetical protein GJW-30_1_02607 [Variibacter gotjawalensis]